MEHSYWPLQPLRKRYHSKAARPPRQPEGRAGARSYAVAVGFAVMAAAAAPSVAEQAWPSATMPATARPAAHAPVGAMAEVARALRAGRHADAFRRVAALADRGDAGAALLALALLRDGQALFGSLWSATPGQLQRWTALAQTAMLELPAEVLGDDGDGASRDDRLAGKADQPRGSIGAKRR